MNQSTPSGTVFIVDDDESFLRSVTRLLSSVGYQVKAFNSAMDFLDELSNELRGCIVADLQMPGLNGLELQDAVTKSANPLPIIFLSAQGDIPTTVRAIRGGAEDFLTKISSKEKLLDAIERAMARDVTERKQRERLRDLHAQFASLTKREMEVLGHVVRGKMNKEIADELGITLRTVKLHRTNLTRRLHVQSVAELTRLVDEAGLFKQDTLGS